MKLVYICDKYNHRDRMNDLLAGKHRLFYSDIAKTSCLHNSYLSTLSSLSVVSKSFFIFPSSKARFESGVAWRGS